MDFLKAKNMRTLAFSSLILLLSMCTSFEPLLLKKENFSNNNLKLNGYYYSLENQKFNAFFIYNNGVYYGGNWEGNINFDSKNLVNLDAEIKKIYLIKDKNPVRFSWGVFNINNSIIKIERWLSGTGGAYPTQMLIGEIKNDTTIHFHTQIGNEWNKNSGKKTTEISRNYYFRPFSPKPDSTNTFIK